MSVILFILAALFCLKILLNFSVPYVLVFQRLKSQRQEENGISLTLEVEIALWLLLILLSYVSNGPTWLDQPKNVIIWGFAAILASYIHFYIGTIAIVGGSKALSMWFQKPKAPKPHQTPFGEFIQKNGSWEGYIEVNNEEVRITTDDVNGQPNPNLLRIIPLIQQKLSQFESRARHEVEYLSPQYELDSVNVTNTNPKADFSLVFVCSTETWSGAINVEFKGEQIVGWWGSD